MPDYQLGLYEKAMPSGLSFDSILEGTKRSGFDYLEISIDETDERLLRLDWSAKTRSQLSATIRAAGIPIRSMCLSGHRRYPLGSHDKNKRDRSVEILKTAVQLSDNLGIRIIQLAGYDVYYEKSDPDTQSWFLENLSKCVEYASKYALLLGFETMETPFLDTVTKSMRFVKAINSPYLGVYPDLGNLTNACRLYDISVESEIEEGRGHIIAMHLKETEEGKYREMRFGTGNVDFISGIRKAHAQGVNMFVAECWYDGVHDWLEELCVVNDFLRQRIEASK